MKYFNFIKKYSQVLEDNNFIEDTNDVSIDGTKGGINLYSLEEVRSYFNKARIPVNHTLERAFQRIDKKYWTLIEDSIKDIKKDLHKINMIDAFFENPDPFSRKPNMRRGKIDLHKAFYLEIKDKEGNVIGIEGKNRIVPLVIIIRMTGYEEYNRLRLMTVLPYGDERNATNFISFLKSHKELIKGISFESHLLEGI